MFRSASWFGMAQAVAVLAGLALQLLVARTLSPADYGRFVLAHSVLLAALVLTAGAVPNALRRLVSLDGGLVHTALRAVATWQVPIALLAGAALGVAAAPVARVLGDEPLHAALLIVAAELTVRAGLVEPCWHVLNGAGRHATQALLIGSHGLLRLACVAAMLSLMPSLGGALAALLLSALASAALALPILLHLAWTSPRPAGDVAIAGELRRWLRLAPGADLLYYLLIAGNLWILKAVAADAAEVGVYAACYMLAQGLLPAGMVLSRTCFSRVAQLAGRGEGPQAAWLVGQVLRLVVPAGVLGVVVAFACGEWIVERLFGTEYAGTGLLLGLTVCGTGCLALHWFLGEMLAAANRLRARLGVLAGVAAFSLPVTLLCARSGGPRGAAAALLMTGAVGVVAAACALRRALGPFFPRPGREAVPQGTTSLLVGLAVHRDVNRG